MSQNPPDLRPDLAPKARIAEPNRPGQPTIGMVSLGCPKALVDSERILTRLRAEGYAISPDYAGAEAVIVNTCGFLDSAKMESLEAIGEALTQNGKVTSTCCPPPASPSRRAITAISRSPRAVTTSASSASSPTCAGVWPPAPTRR